MLEYLKCAFLVIAVLAANASLSQWYRERVMWHGIGERTFRQFEQESADLETLILGDSHPKWGLYPREVGRAFNLALPGQQYAETYYLLKSQLERDDFDIRRVVLQADLHSFAARGLDRFPLAHFYAGTVDYLEMGWRRGSPFTYTVRWLFGRYAPYVGERRNILSYLESGKPADLEWLHDVDLDSGALVRTGSIDAQSASERVENADRRIRMHFGEKDPMSPFLEHYFQEILALCLERRIDVLVVQFPVTREYLDAAAGVIDPAEFDLRVKELIAPYQNALLVETRELFAGRTSLFIDTDHLNERGAIRFSRRIRDLLIAKPGRPRQKPSRRSDPKL